MTQKSLILFAFATLTPAILISLGALFGGWWVIAAIGFLTALTASLDELVRRVTTPVAATEFPASDWLCLTLGVQHFALLMITVSALAGSGLVFWEKALLFSAAGLFFGQVSNSNAHELIHRGNRLLHRFGMWIYISLMFGHHTSAHVLVHHKHVATRRDPNTARLGESFYRFAARAWKGSFRAGYRAEAARLAQIGRPAYHNPYLIYIAGAAMFVVAAGVIGGSKGVVAYLALISFAQTQLMMSDYVQHYGLSRVILPDGKLEIVGDRHSWNSPHWFSSALMLNAPRHSAHHAHPGRSFAALHIPSDGPMLPRSLPVMACVALYPKLWRKSMDKRARQWVTN